MKRSLICPLDGTFVDVIADAVQRDHTYFGLRVSFDVCPNCATVSLCTYNAHGIHGEILTPEDDAYEPERMRPPVGEERQFSRTLGPFEPPNSYQYGYCRNCYAPMRWDVPKQRWVDWLAGDPVVGLPQAVEQPRSFTCPRCRMTSHNPNDAREGYCGNCHDWTGAAARAHL